MFDVVVFDVVVFVVVFVDNAPLPRIADWTLLASPLSGNRKSEIRDSLTPTMAMPRSLAMPFPTTP